MMDNDEKMMKNELDNTIEGGEIMNDCSGKTEGLNRNGGKKGHAMKTACFIAFTLLVALYAALQFTDFLPNSLKLPGFRLRQVAELTAEEQAQLREQVGQIVVVYRQDCEKMLRDFCAEVKSKTGAEFRRAKDAVPETAAKFCKFKVCVKLCYKCVKDRVRKTHDFSDACLGIMREPIILPCVRAHELARTSLLNLEQRLKERRAQFAADLAAVASDLDVDPVSLSEEMPDLQKYVEDTAAKVQEIACHTVATAVGVALEVVFIRQTCSIITRLLGRSIARVTASAGAGIAAAAADGPLPIGDAIGIAMVGIGTVWTLVDIHRAVKVMPQELRTGMYNGIDEIQRNLNQEMTTAAEALTRAWIAAGENVEKRLMEPAPQD